MRSHLICGLMLPALLACGCNDTTTGFQAGGNARFTDFGSRDVESVYLAARATMREYFRIEVADSKTGLIRSVPTARPFSSEPGASVRRFSSPEQVRRIAEIRIESRGDSIRARCSVVIQRNEAAARRAFASQSSSDDLPGRTPLEETQGMDDDRHRIWTTKGYDHKLEQEMLAALSERVAKQRER